VVAALAWGADYRAVAKELAEAPDEAAKRRILAELSEEPLDQELQMRLRELALDKSYAITVEQAEKMIQLRAFAQGAAEAPAPEDAAEVARKITSSPLYREPDERQASNWFARGLERLGDALRRLVEGLEPADLPEAPRTDADVLGFLRVVVWGALVAFLGFVLYWVFRHFSWRSRLERRVTAMLEDEEEALSRDEYLARADELAAEGRHREAVRCLYLACLLLFDEHRVAPFLRGQTNWEHLRRIAASPAKPSKLDFRPPTELFDVVWYGMKVRGPEDVERMRGHYLDVLGGLSRRAA
jgi:hypothetical protein